MEKTIYVFEEIFHEPAARTLAEEEKERAFGLRAKMMKMLVWQKEADVQLLSSEKRYEPFWNIAAERISTGKYDGNRGRCKEIRFTVVSHG